MSTIADQQKSTIDDDVVLVDDDAISFLTEDHAAVQQLFEDYESMVDARAHASEREDVAQLICALLTVHATLEEEIFYPAARELLRDGALVDEALAEHTEATLLIDRIEGTSPLDDDYDDLVLQLAHVVRQHVKDEEDILFVHVVRAGLDTQEVGRRLADRQEELMCDIYPE
jgi:hemerythrin superfamily protein